MKASGILVAVLMTIAGGAYAADFNDLQTFKADSVSALTESFPIPERGITISVDKKGFDYCKDSFVKLATTAAEIQAMDVGPETKDLLLKMNDNARKSVELTCGVTKPQPYDYCKDSFAKLAATAAEIQAMDVSPETKDLLLKMNDNARKSVELTCGSR